MEVNNNISKINYNDNGTDYNGVKRNNVEEVVTKEIKEYQTQDMSYMSKPSGKNNGDNNIPEIPGDVAKAIITEINKKINRNTSAEFAFHKQTNRVMITIKDTETGEIIREIPPEKTLDMIVKIWELAGILVDDKR